MRIAVIGTDRIDGFNWNYRQTLKKMGHNVKLISIDDLFVTKIFGHKITKTLTKILDGKNLLPLLKKILVFRPELVMVFYRDIPPRVIKHIKHKTRAKIIHLNSDAMITMSMSRQCMIDSPYDAWFTKDHIQEKFMKEKLELNVHYLPEAFNPDYHHPLKSPPSKEADISIVGNFYPYKKILTEKLMKDLKCVKFSIHGRIQGWLETTIKKVIKKPLYLRDKANKFYNAKICLNTFHYAEINSVNTRFFEIMGSGGFQICDDIPAVYEFLEKDKEIVTFKTYEELKEKIIFYINHPAQREEIRKRAYKKSEKHTYEMRIKKIFEVMDILPKR